MKRLAAQIESSTALTAAMAGTGWAADFRQLDRGREDVMMDALISPDFTLMRIELSNRIQQRVLPPELSITFGLPTKAQAPGRLGRRTLNSESLTYFHPRSGMEVVSPPGFSAYTLSFVAEQMSQLAELTGMADPVIDGTMHGQLRQPQASALARLRVFLEQLLLADSQSGARLIANAQTSVAADISLEVMRVFNAGTPQPYVSASNRSRALKRSLDYIQQHPRAIISVVELCRESFCSISVLERAFREHFGITPKQYLTAVRLHGARQDLQTAEAFSIGDLASQWGFWHMSKFASDYKRMFGELPSQTRAAVMPN